MRKLFLPAALLLSILVFTSCKDDDEEPAVVVNPFVGTWELLEVELIEAQYEGIVLGPLYFFSISQRIIVHEDSTFQFRFADNEGFILYADGEWEIDDDSTLVLTYDNSNSTSEEYELVNGRLVGQFSFPVPTEEDPEQTVDVLADWIFEKIF